MFARNKKRRHEAYLVVELCFCNVCTAVTVTTAVVTITIVAMWDIAQR
jgi:hypothetical protein